MNKNYDLLNRKNLYSLKESDYIYRTSIDEATPTVASLPLKR